MMDAAAPARTAAFKLIDPAQGEDGPRGKRLFEGWGLRVWINSTRHIMTEIYAQGDLLIERVKDAEPSGTIVAPDATGALVLAEGELSGHRHAIFERATMFRDDALACDMPSDLYIGHVRVAGGPAVVQHDEHAPITLREGTYRVRRQRELEPEDAAIIAD
jgi:hypothetical protein